jgi:hypothetical protein
MTWGFTPVIERHGTDIDAYAVTYTNIPVYGDIGSVYALS